MIKLLGLGDNVCDIYLHENTMYPGGQALNVAVYAKMLGAQSEFLGVNGTDEVAAHVRQTLTKKGVAYPRTRVTEGENGFACVTLEGGERVFKGSNRGGVLRQTPIQLTAEDLDYVAQFDVVHTTNNGFTDSQLPALRRCCRLLSYDFSGRWTEPDRVKRVAPCLDFGFLSCGNESDERVWEVCEELHREGCGTVVATCGGRGAFVYDGAKRFRQPPHLVKAVDTMGAGDSFAACTLVRVAEAVKKAGPGSWHDATFRAQVLPKVLADAADFAAKTCLTHGAFGCGTPVPDSQRAAIRRVLESI